MKRFAAALCILLSVVTLKAESHYKAHISVGFHGGVTLSEVTLSPSVKEKWNPGMTAGVSIRYQEEKLVGVLAELNFVQRGWKENFEGAPLSYSRTINYISLPIMTHINFGSRRFRCLFNLGPEISYMISEKTNANFDIEHPESAPGWPTVARMTEQLTMKVKNKFDYGICGGVGAEFYLTPRNSIYLEGRFYFGLGNIFPAAKADTFGASRNMTISVTLGYNFRLK